MKRALTSVVLAPRNAAIAVISLYRRVVSPIYGDVCRYYPSCSAYGLEAVQEHGLVHGGVLAAWRVCRCHPWAEGGIDDVPARRVQQYRRTRLGFVVAPSHGKG
ncbi:membrane protein insertion efficiency factor YidD [Clavibacter michiganensis]|uniref:Putative membrane protein insertion efficiency factor n=2 Tax=Clavibacter michiganensis subsp. michiganensis TaxID=33013 RepID=YIDD_CLAM3|nr:membrane protein insertion efficiency factor YidD [Clavibacter michiganensis]A5CVC4.1 RecName: Full=Putative membrane protein insertion efficiency factor [Clavibacter michiganensis subsp. michiganensis NCPPB 382]KAF0259706.1 putative membrane protein insertion efficiency factor [Clavibacter michiganensis subsp. michiganensis]MBE3077701.1 membrane protein insertion efficiency factor YidD [Clavibacter michiganensis subsp. michiganensis]MBF4638445.1 membrane protein insertion efficiency factor 